MNPYPENNELLGDEEIITVKPFHYEIEDNWRGRQQQNLHIWCKDKEKNSSSILLRIINFPCLLCMELPVYDEDNNILSWNNELCRNIQGYFNWILEKKEAQKSIFFELKKKLDIYNFSPIKKNYLYLYFPNNNSANIVNKLCSTPRLISRLGKIKLTCHEMKINSIRRLMSLKDCMYSQFFSCKARNVPINYDDRASTNTINEFFIDWNTITPISFEESATWVVNVSLLSFDIETYSSNSRAMPSAFNPVDCITMISCIYQTLNQPETKRTACIVLGECNDIHGSEIIRVKTEIELLLAFAKLVIDMDSDILTGYNIFGYDYSYIVNRFKINCLDIPYMGRLLDRKTKIYDQTWASSAYGTVTMVFITMEGKINIDLYPNIKRLFKLRKYSLDFVSNYFLGHGKHDVSAKEMFAIYERSLIKDEYGNQSLESIQETTKVVAYCIEDSNLVVDLFDTVNIWHHLTELANIAGVSILDLCTRGEQIRCYSNIFNSCFKRGYVVSNPKSYDYYYSGAFVKEPIVGLHENVFTFDFSSLYPSIIIGYNLCYTTYVPQELWHTVREEDCNVIKFTQEEPINFKSSDREKNVIEESDDEESEDEDEAPEKKKKDEKMITRNYEFRFVKPHIRDGILPDLERSWINDRKKVKKELKKVENEVKLLKDEIKLFKSVESRDKLLELESKLKNIEVQEIVLDKRQAAIKVLANSGYGFTGVRSGYLPILPVAMSICALGRQLINKANDFFVENYKEYNPSVCYNDTDSSFISLDLKEGDDFVKIGNEMSEAISGRPEKILDDGTILPSIIGIFPPPLVMEYENFSRVFCLKKKMYAKMNRSFHTRDFERTKDGKMKISPKGILTARRGTSKLASKIYSEVMYSIMNRETIVESLQILSKNIATLMNDEFDVREYLTKVSEMGSNYKSENYSMNLFSNNLAKQGTIIKSGDRIEFIVIMTREEEENLSIKVKKDHHKIYVGNKMREIDMWEKDLSKEEIDYIYYISKGLQDPFDYMFSVGHKDILKDPRLTYVGYTPVCVKSKCKFIHVKEPIKMITLLVEDLLGASYEQLTKIANFKFDFNTKKMKIIAYILQNFINNVCNFVKSM